MGGTELNRETTSLDYDNFSTYAIIFWGEEEASVIKISSFTGCDGQDATKNCIVSGLNLEGRDQNGRVWEICTINACI